jgi:MoxR-like ATPase
MVNLLFLRLLPGNEHRALQVSRARFGGMFPMSKTEGSPLNDSAADPAKEMEFFQGCFRGLEERIAEEIIGQKSVVFETLVAMVAGGHVLLEGVPGLGKTLLVKTIADSLELEFHRVQFTPDLLPTDLLGTTLLVEDGAGHREFRFEPGPVFCNVLLGDEINRATPKTQSALLEAMQEGHVTIAGGSRPLKRPFFVLATQNPLEMEGTYPLPEAQLDRFFFQILVRYPSEDELEGIIFAKNSAEQSGSRLPAVMGAAELLRMREFCCRIPAAPSVQKNLVQLIMATHPDHPGVLEIVRKYVRCGASPRAGQATLAAARIVAALDGRFHVCEEDFARVLLPALRHRLLLRYDAAADGVDADQILLAVIAAQRKNW